LQSHLRSPKHQQLLNECNQGRQLSKSEIDEFNANCLVDITLQSNKTTHKQDSSETEEKKETLKKRLKKLKNKMIAKSVGSGGLEQKLK
jgi:hypothetical protein